MADIKITVLVSVFLLSAGTIAGEFCTRYGQSDLYCPDDCCGSRYSRYCCDDEDDDDFDVDIDGALTTAAIVGIVIGSLFFLAIIVGTIIAIYCCLKGRRSHGGVVYGGNAGTAPGYQITTVPSSGQSTVPAYPQGAYPQTSYPQGQPMAGYPTGTVSPPRAGEKPPPY